MDKILCKQKCYTNGVNYSYEELMSEFTIVDLKGRELQVCTFYQPPFSYLKQTTKKIIDGVEEEVYLANGK